MAYIIENIIAEINNLGSEIHNENKSFKIKKIVNKLNEMHAADVSDIFENVDIKVAYEIFSELNANLRADIFMEFSNEKRHHIFSRSTKTQKEALLEGLRLDEQVDFFDDLTDEEVYKYIKLLGKKEREKVLSLLKFSETSAGGIMESEVFVLSGKMTVSKTISLLQRLKSDKTLNRRIFVVDYKHNLIGSILLEDLVLNNYEAQIEKFMRPIIYKVDSNVDQEEVASYMTHYKIDIVPVVNQQNIFLGVISLEKIAQILEDEASEDILRMASLSPIQKSYFETPVLKLFKQRAIILVILLLMQSVSTMIIGYYSAILSGFLIIYIGMITSTGGNSSSQVSALIIQGIASGEIRIAQMKRFIKREIYISFFIGLFLALVGFIRIYLFSNRIHEGVIVALSLFSITIISTTFASVVPFILRKYKIDPAYSAGPLLATFMDIIGVIIFTTISIFIVNIHFL